MVYNISDIKLTPIIGLDLETNGVKAWENDILVLAITNEDGDTYALPINKYSYEFIRSIFRSIVQQNIKVIGHNIKFDSNFILYRYDIALNNVWDTMLASQLINAGRDKNTVHHDLQSVINTFLGYRTMESHEKKYYQRSFIGMNKNAVISDKQLNYAAEDTINLIALYNAQKDKIDQVLLERIMSMENTLIPVLSDIEVFGCKIDVPNWRLEIKEWEKTRNEYEKLLDNEIKELSKLYPVLKGKYIRERRKETVVVLGLFGEHRQLTNENSGNINYSSGSQILEIFDLLNQPVPKIKVDSDKDKLSSNEFRDSKGVIWKASAGEDVLQVYLTEYPKSPLRKFITLLLKYREYEKLISTYGDKFLAKLDKNNYIHTEYMQCFTDTGRLSSRNPNLQNIPATSIRKFFIPDEDHDIITCDMEGAEVRVAADFSKETALIDSVINDVDLHSKLATISYSIIFDEEIKISKKTEPIFIGNNSFIPKTLRDNHKSVLFAKFYKGGAKRIYEILAEYINLCPGDAMGTANKVSKAIDKELPILSKYLSGLIEEAKSSLILRANKLGRLRHFTSDVYGEAANFPIQGTNADAMKIALIRIYRLLKETKWGRIVMTVHDEVVCSVKKQYSEEAAKMIKQIMAESLGYFMEVVPGGASVEIGPHWPAKG